jgi:protein-tyrosine phosphatase
MPRLGRRFMNDRERTAPLSVSFVCLGNICRSPTAEGMMRSLVAAQGRSDSIRIESAGTSAHHVGERPDRRARLAAERRGVLLDSRARQFRSRDFERLDFVLAMDAENLAALHSLPGAREFQGHLGLLRDFDPDAPSGSEVPDPYYGGEHGFDEVLDLCEAACRGLLDHLQSGR